MSHDFPNSRFARIGRSYPRFDATVTERSPASRSYRRYRITGALVALLSAAGLIGWFLSR
jgi:hypothetical protein